jgi:hypothetical protein
MNEFPPKLDGPRPERNWFFRLPTWGKWTIGIVSALFLMGIGAAIGGGDNNESDLKDEVAALETSQATEKAKAEAEAEKVEEELAENEEIVHKVEGRAKEFVRLGKAKAKEIVGDARAEKNALAEEVDEQEGRLSSVSNEVESVEGKLASLRGEEDEAKEIEAKSTIPGNGTFRAEVDYIPGIYESKGGNLCYWQTQGSADNFDIVNNENATGPTIAEITTPYFQTEGCDTWHRIE